MNNTYTNYNIFALQGDNQVSDADVCETLGLDPSLAGTPAINEAAISKMHRMNYDGYIDKGIEPEEALRRADSLANDTRKKIRALKVS